MKILHVEIERNGAAAEVHFNGWPLHHCRKDSLIRIAHAAEEFAVSGENTLSLWVEPNPLPTHWRDPHDGITPADAWVTARVTAYPPGVFPEPENGEVLATVSWRHGAGSSRFPAASSVEFQRTGPRWSWEAAPILTMSPELVAEATHVLMTLQRAFERQDLDLLMRTITIKIHDAMRAYPALTMTYIRDALQQYLAALQKSPGGPSEPLRPEAHAMRLIAGGRVLECLDADFSPSLRLHDEDGDRLPYPVRLARVEGRLQVVR